MASIIDLSGLTLDRDGISAISEIIFKEKFVSPSWNTFMATEQGIKANKQIVISDNFNGLAGSVRTNCDITPNGDSISATDKTWMPKYVSDRFEDCYENLQATFMKKFRSEEHTSELQSR